MSDTPKIALTLAGSDPSGGAGIQADLKTFSAFSVYGASVIASLTAQNTRGVSAIHDPPLAFLAAQIDAVFDDLDIAATKLGMLSNAGTIACVAERLLHYGAKHVVLDPVMVSKSGSRLLAPDAVEALRTKLVPLSEVLTPNLPEAAVLLGISEGEVLAAPQEAGKRLLELGARCVVLKGGHAGGSFSDDLVFEAGLLHEEGPTGGEVARLSARRTPSNNTHGTGCTFSAAIAAGLAKGKSRGEAIATAKRYISAAIEGSREWKIGRGHGPVDHFHKWWK
jgi:hydroxymethylpyrimidine/phosphomethylpyrimidine kinase